MKITVEKLLNAKMSLTRVFSTPIQDFKTSYALIKIAKRLKSEWETIEEIRIGLVDKYATKDEKGSAKIEEGHYVMENKEEFDKKWKETLATELDIDVWPIPAKVLEPMALSVNDLASIEEFIGEVTGKTDENDAEVKEETK